MKSNSDIEYIEKYCQENNIDEITKEKFLKELSTGKPVQYIIGNVDFYGNIIKVNESVLIPRFETELLVDKTIKKAKKIFATQKLDILDLGTGSGCIAISLKKALNSNVTALDISLSALEIAKINAKENNTEIEFINMDMSIYQNKQYNIIISNPPYIRCDEEIMDIVKNNEPHLALYADNEGLYYYYKILDNLKYIAKSKFLLAFEIGYKQAKSIEDYAKKLYSDIDISVEKDYSDKDRFIFITKKES